MSVKATFVLDDLVLQQAKECVKEYNFKSLSAFVEKAVRDELEKYRQEKIMSALRSAGNDPLVLADIMEVQKDFEYSDFEKQAP